MRYRSLGDSLATVCMMEVMSQADTSLHGPTFRPIAHDVDVPVKLLPFDAFYPPPRRNRATISHECAESLDPTPYPAPFPVPRWHYQ